MKNIIFLLLLFIVSLNAENSDAFKQKQSDIETVKKMIQEEEMIAQAYEKYLIKEKKLPTSLSILQISNYLGTGFSFSSLTGGINFTLSSTTASMTSRIFNTAIDSDANLKALYESSLYRKNTYSISSQLVGIKLNNSLARHLYYLMKNWNRTSILNCTVSLSEFCIKDNHIYIYTDTSKNTLLMYYHINKFIKGPIIISNNTALHTTNDAFNSIRRGTLLYDTDGVKYVKTSDSIEALR